MEYSPKLAYSITESLEDHGIETTRDTYSLIFDNLEGDDLVEAAGFLNYHGFSRQVIGELLGTSAHTTIKIIDASGTVTPDNIVGVDGGVRRSGTGPGRPVAAREDLLVKELTAAVRRLAAFGGRLSPEAAALVKEVSRYDVS